MVQQSLTSHSTQYRSFWRREVYPQTRPWIHTVGTGLSAICRASSIHDVNTGCVTNCSGSSNCKQIIKLPQCTMPNTHSTCPIIYLLTLAKEARAICCTSRSPNPVDACEPLSQSVDWCLMSHSALTVYVVSQKYEILRRTRQTHHKTTKQYTEEIHKHSSAWALWR